MIPEGARQKARDVLSADTNMESMIRAFDWSATPIGPRETWSPALRTTVDILLTNSFPMLLWWGPDYISIYNDAYRPILGRKHPWALGRPVRECWSEIWHVLKPLIDTPFNGGPATWIEDIELEINRSGFTEETHFTVGYSPVRDETTPNGIGGVLATVHEITEKVVGERRIVILRDLGARAIEAKSAAEACRMAAATLASHAKDIPFALLYVTDPSANEARLAASSGIGKEMDISPSVIALDADDDAAIWPLALARRYSGMQVVHQLSSRLKTTPAGPWAEPPQEAVVVPIRSHVAHQFFGFLVAGVSARLRLDEQYGNFLELATTQIATAIANAQAYEEERKRAEALAELDRVKTQFFSNVSHEFRTPLTLMLGPLEEMRRDAGLGGNQRELVDVAHRNSVRLLKLVNSLLDFSRIEAGRTKASYEPVDLSLLTRDLASHFRAAMEAGGLAFIVDCPLLPELIYIDREMWEKIVLNLLSNAFKFTLAGTVTVSLAANGGRAILKVRDTGVGIPPEEIPHIFERFHRVEGAEGRSHEGSGIGLALVQELVRLHGGTISVMSQHDEGSVFTVTLPFGSAHLPQERINAPAAPVSTAPRAEAFTDDAMTWLARDRLISPVGEPPVTSAIGMRRPRVLVADDNADMRKHIWRVLKDGHEITSVANGSDALRAAREIRPDLILTDVMMPGLDGVGLLQQLRRDDRLRDIPVILLSARAGEEARIEGIAAGADDYVTKPFNARELVARINTHIEMARFRRETESALRESEERLSLAVAGSGMGTWDVDLRTGSSQWSARHFEMLGYGSQVGRSVTIDMWRARLHAEDMAGVDRQIEIARTTGRYASEHRIIRADNGVVRWLSELGQLVRDEKGEPFRFVGVSFDITERKQAEQDLRRANQDLEQFAYSASHDLQEPLRTIQIFSQLLEQDHGGELSDEGREFLESVLAGASRMETLLRDLLAYTQVVHIEKPLEPVDAGPPLQAAVANLASAAAESGAAIECGPMPSLPMHAAHLQQLFQNLIGNAIKYRKPDVAPRVRVAARQENGDWLFSVEDNGIGIDPKFRERIFGIFKRLHTADEYSGTGIGLAICQRIVERYQGRIWVHGRAGEGSTFFFSIPA